MTEHFSSERRSMDSRVSRIEEKLKASETALFLARDDVNRRLDEMNALRDQITNERGVYLTRVEYESKQEAMANALSNLQKFQWAATGGLLVVQIFVVVIFNYLK
jgi:septal ring factor EnvC (AmiA/AmiB activator)